MVAQGGRRRVGGLKGLLGSELSSLEDMGDRQQILTFEI